MVSSTLPFSRSQILRVFSPPPVANSLSLALGLDLDPGRRELDCLESGYEVTIGIIAKKAGATA